MTSQEIVTNLIVMLIVFILSAFFVASEFALVQTRPSALADLKQNSTKKSKNLERAINMVHNLNEYLSTTQVGVSLAGIVLGWIGESTIEAILVDFFGLVHLSNNGQGLHIAGAVLGVIILTYLEVVFTEIVPKNISIDMPVKALLFVATPLHYCHVIFYPFVWLLNKSANGVVKLIGLPVADEGNETFSQNEILALSKNAVTGGQLDQNDFLYMQRAFKLNDKVAKDIMIDRTSLYVLDETCTVREAINTYLTEGFSRFPVVEDNDKDNILGYVYLYDLISQAEVDDQMHIVKLIRNIINIPETLLIQDVLTRMIQKQTPIVLVVDEYGGTSGIITDKDIYDELFGRVKDEIDDVSGDYIMKLPNGAYQMSGKMTLYDIERYFHNELTDFDKSDNVTITGYVLDHYPDIKLNDNITIGTLNFTVQEMNHSYIDWFTVKVVKPSLPVIAPGKDKADDEREQTKND